MKGQTETNQQEAFKQTIHAIQNSSQNGLAVTSNGVRASSYCKVVLECERVQKTMFIDIRWANIA